MNILLKIWDRCETWFNKRFGRYFQNARKKDIRDDEKMFREKTRTVNPDNPPKNFNDWQVYIHKQTTN